MTDPQLNKTFRDAEEDESGPFMTTTQGVVDDTFVQSETERQSGTPSPNVT